MKEYKMKCVILGDSSVGKTSIIQHFLIGYFDERIDSTIGASFVSKQFVNKEKNETVKFQVWDTAGQERYRAMIPMYVRDAQVALIVYDITNYDSFLNLKTWLKFFEHDPDICIVIISNKNDLVHLKDSRIKNQDALDFSKDNNAFFFDVSAKEGTNINKLFDFLLNKCKNLKQPKDKKIIHLEDSFSNYDIIKYVIEESNEFVKNRCCLIS